MLKELYEKHKDVILYAFFGVCTTLVNVAVYWLCVRVIGLPVMAGTMIAWVIAVLFAYLTNRKLVFHSEAEDRNGIAKEIAKFFMGRLVTGVLDWLMMFVFVDCLHFNDLLIKIIANIVVIILNYVISKLIVFTKKHEKAEVKKLPMKKKVKYIVIVVILTLLYTLGMFHSGTRLTYLEYYIENEKCDLYIPLDSNNEELRQEFIMPYDIFESIAVKIGTYMRDNNSTWRFTLMDSNGKVIYTNDYNASVLVDNGYNKYRTNKRISVHKGEKYSFSITSLNASDATKLAFYVSNGNNLAGTTLTFNGANLDNTMCFEVYGGDRDYWWYGLTTFIFVYLLLILVRLYMLEKRGTHVRDDLLFQGMVLGALTFILLCALSSGSPFTDENDNMRGGMIIANGGVLYKDYIVQHMPVMYYLCGVFALFGASSIEQFRLSYFIFVSIIWMLVYIRHKKFFGEKKLIALVLIETVGITALLPPYGYQILSDGFQGLCFTVLMLEFLAYYNDRNLNWSRSIIVSLAIWGSFGSAFISLYALVFLAAIFIVVEILYLRKNKTDVKNIFKRYYKLLIALIIPFIIAVVYFAANRALGAAFEQIYTFNRKVYPNYESGIDTLICPFVKAVQYFFLIITDNVNAILNASASSTTILQLFIMMSAIATIVKLFERKRIVEGLAMGLIMIFSATRSYGFHGLAAWYLAIMIITLHADLFGERLKRIGKPVIVIASIIFATQYVIIVGNNIVAEQQSISEIESRIIQITENDENKDIIIDAYSEDSLYLFYKDRKPFNPAVYMLPWYMDWYEDLNVKSLNEKKPRIVVYNEDREVWGRMIHYSNVFCEELKKNYTRQGDEGWGFCVWIRND